MIFFFWKSYFHKIKVEYISENLLKNYKYIYFV